MELIPHLKKLDFERRTAYKKAEKTKDDTTYSDANPITRGYAPLPWAPAAKMLQAVMKPLLGQASPAVPLSIWQDHALYQKMWAHLFINSDYPWRLTKANDWAANGPTIITGFLYEYFLAHEYRRALIKGPGGELRHILVEALPKRLTAAITHQYEDGQLSIVWWDTFAFPRVSRESDDTYRKRSEIAKIDNELSKEISKVVKMIGKSKVASLPTGRYSDDDGRYIAREIDVATRAFVQVCIISPQ